MTVKVQMLIEIEIPKSLEEGLQQMYGGKEGVHYSVHQARQLTIKFPAHIPWMVKNNYSEFDLLVRVDNESQVEEPMA